MAESVGEQLKLAREARNLTFDQVSEATRIRPYYIQALEKDDYSAVPSAAQARGFLRIYATYLGLDVDELLSKTMPVEPAPAMPSPEIPAPPAQTTGTAQQAEKPRPGFLASLRGRFARQASVQPPEVTVAPAPAATQPEPLPEPRPVLSTPKAVVSVEVNKEELIEQQTVPVQEQPRSKKPSIEKNKTWTKRTAAGKSTKTKSGSKDNETPASAKARKPVVKLKKSAEEVSPAAPLDEKKKMTG